MSRHQRLRKVQVEIVQLVAMFATNLDRVSKPGSCEQGCRRALAFDDSIRHKGRSVHQRRHLLGFDRAIMQRVTERGLDSQARVAWSGQRFSDDGAAILAHHQKVGKSAANIYPDSMHSGLAVRHEAIDIRKTLLHFLLLLLVPNAYVCAKRSITFSV